MLWRILTLMKYICCLSFFLVIWEVVFYCTQASILVHFLFLLYFRVSSLALLFRKVCLKVFENKRSNQSGLLSSPFTIQLNSIYESHTRNTSKPLTVSDNHRINSFQISHHHRQHHNMFVLVSVSQCLSCPSMLTSVAGGASAWFYLTWWWWWWWWWWF